MKTSIRDIRLLNLKSRSSEEGSLVAIEELRDIPISISRVFYVYDSDSRNRGNHAHFRARQCLICVNGGVIVTCSDGCEEVAFHLNSPDKLLYLPEMIWDSIDYVGTDTVLLVLSDSLYEARDYIETFEDFKKMKKLQNSYTINENREKQ